MSVFRNKSEILLLEPCDGKLSRTVLRGESARKGADLPALGNLIESSFPKIICIEMELSDTTSIVCDGQPTQEDCTSQSMPSVVL